MITEVTDNELSALRGTFAGDVKSVEISAERTGFEIRVDGSEWVPLGHTRFTNDRERFPKIGNADILSFHFQDKEDRFVILGVVTRLAGDEYVTAYVGDLRDREWNQGSYHATYEGALMTFQHKAGLAIGSAPA